MRDPALTIRAKTMRKAATEPEQRMWLALRAKRFESIKFRRQKVIGAYIVDFAARDPMLVIEIDGDTHAGREDYDASRTAFLESEGYRVARFTNAEVMGNFEGVMQSIEQLVHTPPLPTLSPQGERAI